MKPCNNLVRLGCACILALLCIAGFSQVVSAQTTLLPKEKFTSSTFPSGWTDSYGYNDYTYDGYGTWFWSSDGVGSGDGAAMDDIWDYSGDYMNTPYFDASGYTTAGDSVWVDFDFFWEYNGYDEFYQYSLGYPMDYFEIDVNGADGTDFLAGGTTDQFYTYYNTSDYNYDAVLPSSSYWKHYHILIPSYDLSSDMTISFGGYASQGLSDPAIDNVVVTAKSQGQELSLLPNPKVLNFGSATPNTPDTMYATVSNVGILPLTIQGITFSGSPAYSEISGAQEGDVIQPGNSEQIGIQFQPFSSGVINGRLTVATDGLDSGTQAISLSGIGAVANVSYSSNVMFRGTAVEVDSTSGVQYLYVNSTGNGPLVVTGVQLVGIDARAYTITHVPTGLMPPGSVDSIGVRFSPDLEGLPDAHMIITSTGVNNPSDTVLMAGVGILPHLQLIGPPDNVVNNIDHTLLVNFDSVKIGSNACMQVVVSNPGSDTLAILQSYLSSKDFDFTLTPLVSPDTLVPPGGTKTVQVCFTPLQRGYRTATVTLLTNIPHTQQTPAQDTSKFYIQFIGTGVPTGQLSISGPTNDTLAVGTNNCVVDTFWNTGDADLTVTNVSIAGTNASVFTSANLPTPFVIPANSIQTFTVCASPNDTGMEVATLMATGITGTAPLTATMPLFTYGTSVNDTAVIAQALGTTCMPGTDTAWIVVQNRGNVPEAYTASVAAGGNSADFSIVPPATSPVLGASGTVRFKVAFTPSMKGPESATINIAGGINENVVVLGMGGAADINGSGIAPATPVGQTSDPFTATVQNTGTCDWIPGQPTISDPEFTYVSGGTSVIPAGGSGQLTFTYTPVSGGTGMATLSFPSESDASIPAANVTLTAASLGVPQTSSNGFSLEQNYPNPFGSVSQSSEVVITVPTSGEVTLSIVDVTGKLVERVLDRHFDAGSYTVSLDAANLSSGTYYYQMAASGVTLMRQMVIVK